MARAPTLCERGCSRFSTGSIPEHVFASALRREPDVVRRAERFIRAHVGEPVSSRSCPRWPASASGASATRSRTSARRVRRYLKIWQLHQVRRALRASNMEGVTVTDAATLYGFFELAAIRRGIQGTVRRGAVADASPRPRKLIARCELSESCAAFSLPNLQGRPGRHRSQSERRSDRHAQVRSGRPLACVLIVFLRMTAPAWAKPSCRYAPGMARPRTVCQSVRRPAFE